MNVIDRFRGDYAFLSNFYPAPFKATTYFAFGADEERVELGELTFPTVEHWMQATKARAENPQDFLLVLASSTPGHAKRAGRKILLRSDWEDVKEEVVLTGVRHKFLQNPILAQRLKETGNARLIEGNDWGDRTWGMVWDSILLRWEGENLLGEILQQVRDELMDTSAEA